MKITYNGVKQQFKDIQPGQVFINISCLNGTVLYMRTYNNPYINSVIIDSDNRFEHIGNVGKFDDCIEVYLVNSAELFIQS